MLSVNVKVKVIGQPRAASERGRAAAVVICRPVLRLLLGLWTTFLHREASYKI